MGVRATVSVASYRDLVAWQKGMDLAELVYRLAHALPETEKFGLAHQLRRAAVSVPSALAEGHARTSTKEFLQCIAIALGSLAEIETQLLLCARLALLDEQSVQRALVQCDEQSRILRGLKKSLQEKLAAPRPLPLGPRP